MYHSPVLKLSLKVSVRIKSEFAFHAGRFFFAIIFLSACRKVARKC